MGGKAQCLPRRAVDTEIAGCPLRNPRMKKASPRVLAPWSLLSNRYLHFAVLVALPFAIYSNNYRHAYVLDDGYTLLSNPHVRSLSEIPRYFVDPSTYTSLREQVDYRPLLQV